MPLIGRSLTLILALAVSALPAAAGAQSTLGRSPNLRPEWTAPRGAVFVFAHRFEFLAGGDEMLNVPTLTLGSSIARGLAIGLDFSSNSELVADRLGQNETQYWVSLALLRARFARLGATVAYNTAAGSMDGALTAAVRSRTATLMGEARLFGDALGTGEGGFATAIGAVVHLTPYLELSADVGQLVRPDTLGRAWSSGVAIAIPGTPHTLSIHASNGGALTLQSVSRPKELGPEPVRYGFTFTVPLGSGAQWGRVFRRSAAPAHSAGVADSNVARVSIRAVAFTEREVRIRAGKTVEWTNYDPMVHTVTSDDGTWGSGFIAEGDRFSHTFATPGRYPYHCQPHPQMRGVVIVQP